MMEQIEVAVAVLVGIISTARLTRLLTQDSFPPSVWLRMKWDSLTNDGPWSTLMHCHFCLAPWLTVPIGIWGWLTWHTDFQWTWWVFNGWLAVAYLASMVVQFDEGKD